MKIQILDICFTDVQWGLIIPFKKASMILNYYPQDFLLLI